MELISKRGAKKWFEKSGMKIGKEAVISFIRFQEERIEVEIDKAVRNARISGRRVVKSEDFRES